MPASVTLGTIRLQRGLPAFALQPAPALAPPRRIAVQPALASSERRILFISTRHLDLRTALKRRGAIITSTEILPAATDLLAVSSFDAVAIEPELDGAIAWVKALKLSGAIHDADLLLARTRHPLLPTFILPLDQEVEYAVIVQAPHVAFLEQSTDVSIVEAMLRLNVRALMKHVPPPAY